MERFNHFHIQSHPYLYQIHADLVVKLENDDEECLHNQGQAGEKVYTQLHKMDHSLAQVVEAVLLLAEEP